MGTDIYIALIYKSLKGTITSDEAKQLSEWKQMSSKNQAVVDEIQAGWESSDSYELPFELDMEGDFAKIQSAINEGTPKTAKVVTMNNRRKWMGLAAAAIAILLIATTLWRPMNRDKQQWEMATATDGINHLNLADGTQVWLNVGSTLRYPKAFSEEARPVQLEGEAYFVVSKDAKRPFQVKTKRNTVTVLGTEFNVRDIAVETTTEVTVNEGKVAVQAKSSTQKIILTANEKAIFDEKNNELREVADADLNGLAWQRNSLRFNATQLNEVLNVIARQYQVSFDLSNSQLSNCPVSGRYATDTKLSDLLTAITGPLGIRIEVLPDRQFKLLGGSCK